MENKLKTWLIKLSLNLWVEEVLAFMLRSCISETRGHVDREKLEACRLLKLPVSLVSFIQKLKHYVIVRISYLLVDWVWALCNLRTWLLGQILEVWTHSETLLAFVYQTISLLPYNFGSSPFKYFHAYWFLAVKALINEFENR